MKCSKHNNEDAVGTCNVCGVGICSTCNALFEPQLCLRCGDNLNRKEKINSIVTLISPFFLIPLLGYVIWFVFSGGSQSLPILKILKCGFGALLVGHGMYFLCSKKKPQTFGEEIGNAIIAIPVLFISFILSPWVGMCVLPWKMFKSFKFLSQLKQGDADRAMILNQAETIAHQAEIEPGVAEKGVANSTSLNTTIH